MSNVSHHYCALVRQELQDLMDRDISILYTFPQLGGLKLQAFDCFLKSLKIIRGSASSPLQPFKLDIDYCFTARELSMTVNAIVRFWHVSTPSRHQRYAYDDTGNLLHWATMNAFHGTLALFSKKGNEFFFEKNR